MLLLLFVRNPSNSSYFYHHKTIMTPKSQAKTKYIWSRASTLSSTFILHPFGFGHPSQGGIKYGMENFYSCAIFDPVIVLTQIRTWSNLLFVFQSRIKSYSNGDGRTIWIFNLEQKFNDWTHLKIEPSFLSSVCTSFGRTFSFPDLNNDL